MVGPIPTPATIPRRRPGLLRHSRFLGRYILGQFWQGVDEGYFDYQSRGRGFDPRRRLNSEGNLRGRRSSVGRALTYLHRLILAGLFMSFTPVVNRHREKYDVYVGRGTPWGNNASSPDDERMAAVEKYRVWFLNKIKTDPEFKRITEELRGKRLGCSCKPAACHADVISAWLDGEISEND